MGIIWHFVECTKLIHFKEAVKTKELLHEDTVSLPYPWVLCPWSELALD